MINISPGRLTEISKLEQIEAKFARSPIITAQMLIDAIPKDKPLGRSTGLLDAACMYATKGGIEKVKLLIANGADIKSTNKLGWTALHKVADLFYFNSEHLTILEMLLKQGANPNAKDNSGNTPLHKAAASGNYDIALWLLENGANPNLKNQNGESLTKIAKIVDNNDILKLLKKWETQ